MDERGISPLLASIIIVAIMASTGFALWRVISGRMRGVAGPDIQVLHASIFIYRDGASVSLTVKNTGDVMLENLSVTIYGENGLTWEHSLGPLEVGGRVSCESWVSYVYYPRLFLAGRDYTAVFRAYSSKGTLSKAFTILVR